MLFPIATWLLLLVPTAVHDTSRIDVAFPPQDAIASAAVIHVRGTASSSLGIGALYVGGVAATSPDGFAHWTATVPLRVGRQDLPIDVVHAAGELEADVVRVSFENRGPLLLGASALAECGGTLLLANLHGRSIDEFDPKTGETHSLSSGAVGAGVALWAPEALDADSLAGVAWVLDAQRLLRVDLGSGDRTVVSGQGVGSGPALGSSRWIARDEASQSVLVLGALQTNSVLFAVDAATGDRSHVSSPTIGAGPTPGAWRGLALEPGANRALTVDVTARALIAIDLATGDRSVVSDDTFGSGPSLSSAASVSLDAARNRALVVRSDDGGVIGVDLSSGARTWLAQATHGFASLSDAYLNACLARDGAELLVLSRDVLASLELATGLESVVEHVARGAGPSARGVHELALTPDGARGFVLVAPFSRTEPLAFDAAAGNRAYLGGAPGTLPVGTHRGLVYDASGARLLSLHAYAFGAHTALTVLDAVTGAVGEFELPDSFPRTVADLAYDASTSSVYVCSTGEVRSWALGDGTVRLVSGHSLGSGRPLAWPQSPVLDLARRALYVIDSASSSVLRVDLDTGDRLTVASWNDPQPGIGSPRALALDPERRQLVVADLAWCSLTGIDLVTHQRKLISKSSLVLNQDATGEPHRDVGNGPRMGWPTDVAVDSARGVAYVADDFGTDGILCVDLESGDRVLVSR